LCIRLLWSVCCFLLVSGVHAGMFRKCLILCVLFQFPGNLWAITTYVYTLHAYDENYINVDMLSLKYISSFYTTAKSHCSLSVVAIHMLSQAYNPVFV